MVAYRLAAAARKDMQDIALYIGRDNPQAASDFIARLKKTCSTIATQPRLGKSEANNPVRRFPIGRYILYYRITSEQIHPVEILRVLHSARERFE